MTPVVTPSDAAAPDAVPVPTGPHVQVQYVRAATRTFKVSLPAPAPPNLRLCAHFHEEPEGVWARVDEIDVAAEGESLDEAFRNLIATIRSWLEYLREDAPELTDQLRGQARYLPLLDAPEFSWFRSIKLD